VRPHFLVILSLRFSPIQYKFANLKFISCADPLIIGAVTNVVLSGDLAFIGTVRPFFLSIIHSAQQTKSTCSFD
jgi:hypothetical protein